MSRVVHLQVRCPSGGTAVRNVGHVKKLSKNISSFEIRRFISKYQTVALLYSLIDLYLKTNLIVLRWNKEDENSANQFCAKCKLNANDSKAAQSTRCSMRQSGHFYDACSATFPTAMTPTTNKNTSRRQEKRLDLGRAKFRNRENSLTIVL